MQVVLFLCRLIAGLISLFTVLIFVRVIFTWIPSLAYSKVGKILSEICDPYLNWFRRFKFVRIGALDFSPVLAIGALLLVSSILQNIVLTGHFSLGIALGTLISVVATFISSFLNIFTLLILIRLIFELVNKKTQSYFWHQLDSVISKIAYRITKIFAPRKFFSFTVQIVIVFVTSILLQIVCSNLLGFVANLCFRLPI